MKILVIDDEAGLRQTISQILTGEGYDVATAPNGAAGLTALEEEQFDIVVCDIRMPTMDGLTFLERAVHTGNAPLIVMMSAYGEDDDAIMAMQRGAYDYIAKPFRPDQLILLVRKAIEREKLQRQVNELSEEVATLRDGERIVGSTPALREVIALARKVARHPSTVLITGESGTGKELIARMVHRASPRAIGPFVAVNCGAIPEALLESELFGHAKGSFTGATTDRRGLFEEAIGGTIFLDEIGELPPLLQVKLLRVLQEGEIRPVGENATRPVDSRVVAATARHLEDEVATGRFRADLFYRINVVRLHLPPLRERRADIGELAQHFVEVYNARLGLGVGGIAPAAIRLLTEYAWPGNIRELENAIERSIVLAEGSRIQPDDLPDAIRGAAGRDGMSPASAELSVKRQTEALERVLIKKALEQTGGNRTRAARLLELSHRALLYKIREYGLES
ncbi:MAG: sigma-54 dependent transcriptional regulator [Gemmatimonadaceae bacterium]